MGFFFVIIISLIFLLFCFWPSTFCLIYTLKENQFLSQLVPPLFKDIIIYVYQRKMLIEIVKLFPKSHTALFCWKMVSWKDMVIFLTPVQIKWKSKILVKMEREKHTPKTVTSKEVPWEFIEKQLILKGISVITRTWGRVL